MSFLYIHVSFNTRAHTCDFLIFVAIQQAIEGNKMIDIHINNEMKLQVKVRKALLTVYIS